MPLEHHHSAPITLLNGSVYVTAAAKSLQS